MCLLEKTAPELETDLADDRTRAVELALSQIEKQFGKGSIMRLGSKEAIVPISVIRQNDDYAADYRRSAKGRWPGGIC